MNYPSLVVSLVTFVDLREGEPPAVSDARFHQQEISPTPELAAFYGCASPSRLKSGVSPGEWRKHSTCRRSKKGTNDLPYACPGIGWCPPLYLWSAPNIIERLFCAAKVEHRSLASRR